MNDKIFHLISSLASLLIGIILLVCVCLAWYTNNAHAGVEGTQGIISEGEIYNVQLTRYIATEEDNTFTKTAINQENILPYDLLQGYTKLIYEISFDTSISDLSRLSLSLRNTSTTRNNEFSQENSIYYNYLSNVAIFKELTINEQSKYLLKEPENSISIPYSEAEDTEIHTVLYSDLSFNKSGTNVKINLLFDFNSEHINQLYSANLGITSNVRFRDDLEFILRA